jgi:chromosome segregation protein
MRLLQEQGEEQAELRGKLQIEKEHLGKCRAGLSADEERLRGLRDKLAAAKTEASRLELKLQEVKLGIEALRERVEGRYNLRLAALLDRLEQDAALVIEAGEGAQAQVPIPGVVLDEVADLRVTPENLEDPAAVKAWVAMLEKAKNALQRLGDVNLAALEEYTEVAERHKWLSEQQADLELSVDAIRRTIAKINKTCRERFRDAFDRVNAYFKEIYPRLVGGGQARLSLTNEEDLLETGVDIFVQPPGKRLQNLSLLSGGEKAMCAIGLLFSLFKVKPSPFCLLDEVDAPLDEGNGARFNSVLQEMSSLTQFIVITHNKKTMEVVDTLYGVTMPEPGASRLVSVKVD